MEAGYKSGPKLETIGNYKVRNIILGKGNFATVYFAVHNLVGTAVALKVIDKREIKEEYVRANLHRESRILRRLQHPNIVKLYETLQSSDYFCLSLELIKGVSMSEYLKSMPKRRVAELKSKSLFYQMLSGVQHMHDHNVIHRDLKLENLMIENDCVIKIVDFGLSNQYFPCRKMRTHCGSVEYAAPELFHSRCPYTYAVDMWSLGVVLYAMVVGQMPFPYPRNVDSVQSRRQALLANISKGLNAHNRDRMQTLSQSLWQFLHALLEPNQFRRIPLHLAISHSWIVDDPQLKAMLPKSTSNFYREFHPEVVTFLSKTQHLPEDYVEKHVRTYKEDDLAAMYSILSDTLVKDALHPSKGKDDSYIDRFRKRIASLKKEENLRKGMKQRWKKDMERLRTESQMTTVSETESYRSVASMADDSQRTGLVASKVNDRESTRFSKASIPASRKASLQSGLRLVPPSSVTRIPRLPTVVRQPQGDLVRAQKLKTAASPPPPPPLPPPVKSYKASRPNVSQHVPSLAAKDTKSIVHRSNPQPKPQIDSSRAHDKLPYKEYRNTTLHKKNVPGREQNRKASATNVYTTNQREPAKQPGLSRMLSKAESEMDEEVRSQAKVHRSFRNSSIQNQRFSPRGPYGKGDDLQKPSLTTFQSNKRDSYAPSRLKEPETSRIFSKAINDIDKEMVFKPTVYKNFRNSSVQKQKFSPRETYGKGDDLRKPSLTTFQSNKGESFTPYGRGAHSGQNSSILSTPTELVNMSQRRSRDKNSGNSPFLSTPIEDSSRRSSAVRRQPAVPITRKSPIPRRLLIDSVKTKVPVILPRPSGATGLYDQVHASRPTHKSILGIVKDGKHPQYPAPETCASAPVVESKKAAANNPSLDSRSTKDPAAPRGLSANLRYGVPSPGFVSSSTTKDQRSMCLQQGDYNPNPAKTFGGHQEQAGSKVWKG